MTAATDRLVNYCNRRFDIPASGSSVRREIVAGLTTFLAMVYIVVVNPAILSEAGMDFGAVFVATCIAAAVGTLLMGLFANYPIALAPGMGQNAFFTYAVVLGSGHPWQVALGAVFLSGVIFILLSVLPVREWLINAIPKNLKHGMSVGIGLFLAFIAMQGVPGETLEARLARETNVLDETTVREFVSQIASGLSAAHQRQLIHRDIKPANIWICDDTGRIKILDFGLARIADEESSLTQTGMLAGTPSYMSPEQARGMELDPRSDLFSLGCVMYLLLTDRLPFSASTVLGTLQTIQSDSPQPPIALNAKCDADLSDLTMSLLEKLPGNRMASAENLIQCLQKPRDAWPQKVTSHSSATDVSGKALAAGSVAAKPSTVSQRSSSSGIRWLIAASLLGLIGTIGWLMAPQIFRIATNQGELVIETSDENIKIQVLENGDLFRVLDASTKDSFDIRSGVYSFNVVSEDNQSEFEVTPKSVTMKRGGKQLVTVSISNSKTPEPSVSDRDAIMSPAEITAKLMQDKQTIDKTYGKSSSPEKREAQFDAMIAAYKYQRDLLADRVGPEHPTTRQFDLQIKSMMDHRPNLIHVATSETPVYGGRNFEQWMAIAKKDREPKTVSDAIVACGFLIDEGNKNRFVALLRQLARQHGKAGCNLTTFGGQTSQLDEANVYFAGILKAINQLEPIEVSRFVQGEIEFGNENSLGFCSGIFHNAFFNGNGDKRKEFVDRMLNIDPLLKRIRDGQVKLDWNIQSFFADCFRQTKTEVDLDLCKDAIRTLDVEERPWTYQSFMTKFKAGEFDTMIESDFFADSTDSSIRESFIHSLKFSGYSSGMGVGGGGVFRAPKPDHRTLLSRLLMESIVRTLYEDKPKLTFKTYQYICFTDDRVVTTSVGQNGEMYWMSKTDGLTRNKPDGMSEVRGKAAVARHLFTELCQNVSSRPLEDDERDELVAFFKEMAEGSKVTRTEEFSDLKIPQDADALLRLVKGDGDEKDFSYFVPPKNSGRVFGGGGGGGVF